jgi:hypothetical protein
MLIEIAINCIRQGWYVFPCSPKTKRPLGSLAPHGVLDASNDEAQIRAWWTIEPEANVAIACGLSGLSVVDCDHGNRTEAEARAWMDRAGLPRTFTVRTGRRWDPKDPERKPEFGIQLYYAGAMPSVGEFLLAGGSGQIKSLGGYVMAAGSIHPESGQAYEVMEPAPIAETPEFVRALKTERKPAEDDGQPITENRNIRLTSIAGKLRNAGLSAEALRVALLQVNADRCQPPLEEDEVERIATSARKWELPAEDPVVVIRGPEQSAQPEPATLPERVRPIYPISAWEGTAVAEFVRLCTRDNNIPPKMYAEAFRCVLGAVVGDRLSCPGVEGALPRTYTVIVAPKGKGKGTAIRRAVRFFNHAWDGTSGNPSGGGVRVSFSSPLLSGERDFEWKPKGIGAWMAAASSVPGMARLCKDLESTVKSKPHLTWGSTLPRVLSVHEEMKTFLSTLFIEGGVGSGMEGVVCQLWDDVSFHGTATGTREAAYGEMMFSMLCGVTEQDWFDLLSRGNAVGSGLMSRFNMIGTEGGYENVSRMNPPDFTALQETFLPRVMQLEDAHTRLVPSEAADRIISEWTESLPEGSERMNIHAWRSALLIAWLRHEATISAKTAEDAVSLGRYQVASHEYYRTRSADTANARVQARIVRALEMRGPMKKRALQKATHAERDGTDLWSRALDGLIRDKSVGKREDGTHYLAA